MTAQQADILINEHPRVDLRNLDLYFVLRGDGRGGFTELELPVPPRVPETNRGCSALWRGYIATFRLTAEGCFELVRYDFPYCEPPAPPQVVVGGRVTGDFWLGMRPFFYGPNTNIPFREGRIVEDQSAWDVEDQSLRGQVVRRLEDAGLLVFIDEVGPCFMPRSLIPSNLAEDLDALVNRPVVCEIHHVDDQRRTLILRPIAFPNE